MLALKLMSAVSCQCGGVSSDVSTDRDAFWDVGVIDPPTYPVTLFGYYRSTENTTGVAFGFSNNAVSNQYFWIGASGANNAALGIRNTSSLNITGSDMSDQQPHTVIGVFASATDRRLYFDGNFDAGGSGLGSRSLWTASSASSYRMALGGLQDATPGSPFNGVVFLAGSARVAWSPAQARKFHRNPWQLFQSPTVWIGENQGAAPPVTGDLIERGFQRGVNSGVLRGM